MKAWQIWLFAIFLLASAAGAQGWHQFGKTSQHTALSSVPAVPMERVIWSASVNERSSNSGRAASPIITNSNTVIMSVKSGTTSIRYEARNGASGVLQYTQSSDFIDLSTNSVSGQAVITPDNKLVVPAAGGTILVRSNADSAGATVTRHAFFGLSNFNANPGGYAGITIITPIISDSQSNVYFGFRTSGSNPLGIVSGIARVTPAGVGSWISANAASGGESSTPGRDSSPSLSNDETVLYIAWPGASSGHYLSMLNAVSLSPIRTVHLLVPGTSEGVPYAAGSSCPMIGPDNDVYFGSWGSNGSEGYMHHYNSTLTTTKIPGAFGWDTTASLVPASAVPSYTGPSSYLISTKYNHYYIGDNRVAVLDPSTSANNYMEEVVTVRGVTPDPNVGPNAVVEWCINSIAVDPFTKATMAHSEDGWIYRWDFAQNRLTERVQLSNLLAEAYEPTIIGPDGTVYAVNKFDVFAIGPGPRTYTSSIQAIRGMILAGGIAQLADSDNDRLVARPGPVLTSLEAPLQLVLDGTSASATATSLKFTVEAQGSTSSIRQIIQLYNFQSGQYETYDDYSMMLSDGRMQVTAVTPQSFIEGGTRAVRAKLSYRVSGPVLVYPWQARIDQAYWNIEP
jgi:hypothetical protein